MDRRTPRIVEELNAALHRALAANDRLYLLGEDIADPYGGAFKVTKGLTSAYPDRVLTTPISESAMVGMAGGLALCGNQVIVEVMFGDFLPLAFDQILNFMTKSVSMYGTRTPMPVVVRCPVGGNRGYGPTHSQSVQKYFLGIPHLALFELTPFHDPADVLNAALARDEPAILFEDKVLYTRRRYVDGHATEDFDFQFLDGDRNWAHVRPTQPHRDGPPVLLIATGGTAQRALDAATELLRSDGLTPHVLVPARLYPVDTAPLLPLVETAVGTWVIEESTAGGTWGAEVSALLHQQAWESLRAPVRLVQSMDSVIPAASDLEHRVLVQAHTIRERILAEVRTTYRDRPPAHPVAAAAQTEPVVAVAQTEPVAAAEPVGNAVDPPSTPSGAVVRVPALNSNDTSYVLVEWLVEDGATVTAGTPVALVETSKATEELVAESDGRLRHRLTAGADCTTGTILADLDGADRPAAGPSTPPPPVHPTEESTVVGAVEPLSPIQRRVAALVSASHREIPPGFAVIQVVVDATLALAERLAPEYGPIGLPEFVIATMARLRTAHPEVFGSLRPDATVHYQPGVHVAVTIDAGTGLFLPVIRDVTELDLPDLADRLVDLRMGALRSDLRDADGTGANIALSVNPEPGLLFVQPVIPPGLAVIVSVTAASTRLALSPDGQLVENAVVGLGLAYDHRLINGRAANAFLNALGDGLREAVQHELSPTDGDQERVPTAATARSMASAHAVTVKSAPNSSVSSSSTS